MKRCAVATLILASVVSIPIPARAAAPTTLPADTGYRGIWYQIATKDGPKYSGGFATYPQQIRPLAIYRKEVDRTFFVYGGRPKDKNTLLHMVSYYDHATGTVPRPRILLDKKTTDAHDNPALAIDDDGYLWIFSNTHGPEPRSYIHRSAKPYSIDAFEQVAQLSLSYGQPWYLSGRGFMLVQNRYTDGRAVAFQTSPDGRTWSKPQLLAKFKGHYQISAPSPDGKRVAVAFNYHPRGLDTRTNLYYIETPDFGRTWQTVDGTSVPTPLTKVQNPALVHDYEAEGLLVYLKDIQFDPAGHPVLVYLTSKGHMPGPANAPYTWWTARWDGHQWLRHPITTSDHNYDFGQLYLEPVGPWRLIAPTDPGPKPYLTGGDVVLWTSPNQGTTWTRLRTVTHDSPQHHTYVRQPVHAKPDFYAFWADGDPEKPSDSHLYFTNKEGTSVWTLPDQMDEETAHPIPPKAP